MDQKLHDTFVNICKENIKRDGIENLLNWLETSDFFVAPASTRFHGAYEGGLVEHSISVYKCLSNKLMFDTKGVYGGIKYEYPSKETVAIVALFHDLCKVNSYSKNVHSGSYFKCEKFPCGDHSDKSIIILQQFMKLLPEEILAIRAHMGGWDYAVRGGSSLTGQIFDISRLAVHLHIADMESTYLVEARPEREKVDFSKIF